MKSINKSKKTVYTYTITNEIMNEIVYVGSTSNPRKRFYAHKWRANNVNNNKCYQKYAFKPIHYHMAEFGIENFSFSIVADNNCEAELQEQIKPLCCVKYEKCHKSYGDNV